MTQCRFQYEPGDVLDSFTIGEGLYCGALAEIYRGTDGLTHQAVAIKVPSLDIINRPLVFYHFQNETRVLEKIHHPCIVRYIPRDRTAPYSVFEYIAGRDLHALMKREGPLPLEAARHYLRQIGQGLSYIHDCGVIHLDIKPENIIVTPRDTVKIIDFGLARRLGAPDMLQEDFTRPHGTPYYAAPEQLERYRDDPRTDLYSLALVLYEMLTGELPFERTIDLGRVRRRLKTDPVPPRTYRREIPESVETVILKALDRYPDRRFPSIDAFVRALDEADDPGPQADARPATAPSVVPPACPVRLDAHYRHILAAIDDSDQAQAIVETALLVALSDRVAVTLLTVVSDSGDDWTRYADEVAGKRWGRRLESFTRRFRRFGIEPTVRILTGSPADRILETARDRNVDLIIMGASRRSWIKRLFGGRILDRVLKKAPCRVRIADVPLPSQFPWDDDPFSLPSGTLDHIDRYLVSLWTRQVNWLADCVQSILSKSPPVKIEADGVEQAPLTAWITDLHKRPQWSGVIERLDDTNRRFQQLIRRMIEARNEAAPIAVERMYRRQVLPELCRLREAFQALSDELRGQNASAADRPRPMLDQAACPIGPAKALADPFDELQDEGGGQPADPSAKGGNA